MGPNEAIARWADFDYVAWVEGEGFQTVDFPKYDTDIREWHGDDGLLQKIEERGGQFRLDFIDTLVGHSEGGWGLSFDDVWLVRRAEAPQLAAALLKCIEGERHD